jgi:2-keto-4-pentenoate hydratase/2-oxohepta-3-ene-1,7-dioic acid hydratase in catechol pathway
MAAAEPFDERAELMRYASFLRPDGLASYGLQQHDQLIDLGRPGAPASLRQAIADGTLAEKSEGPVHALSDITLLPVIPDPAKIICIGLNYATHVAETGRDQKEYPAVFTRWADSLVAHGQPLIKPAISERFDYEGELAVIIGTGGRNIARADALAHVAGYSIFNDASVRDWQRHNIQFTPGKNFPATGAFGPAMVTPDEIADLGSQRVQTRLNGELVQDQPISDMIWDVPFLIEYISAFTPLAPGDVIVSGTPGGVGDKRNPPLYMRAGDTVEVEIGVIGTLINTISE